jgi:two-component system, NarL family, sensor kinase
VGVGTAVLVAVASVGAFVSTRVGRDHVLRQPVAGGEVVATRVVAPLVTQGVYDGRSSDLTALDDRVRIRKAGGTFDRVKVWSADGVILYCDDPRLIGQRYPLDSSRSRALTDQETGSMVADLSSPDNVLDRGSGQSLDVYAGTRDAEGRPILVETYFDAGQLNADEAASTRRIVAVVLGSLLVFGLLLVPVAYSLARRTSRVNGADDVTGEMP